VKAGNPNRQRVKIGPLLFIIHMNDLPLHLNETHIDLFADDATQYSSGMTLQNVEENLNSDIQPIVLWNAENRMVLNEKKTKAMIVTSSSKMSKLPDHLSININGSQIETVPSEKLLGVYIDPTLTWSTHIDYICKKISQRLGILRRIRHNLTYGARLAFYNCLILSLMDYCCVVWGNTSKGNLDRIHRLQKKAARLILDRESKAPSLPLFIELGWLPIHDRIKFMRATIVFKALNGLSPSYITDLILPFSKVHNIDTRRARRNLLLPKANTNSGKRTFAFLASSEWNLLPDGVKTSTSLSSFKRNYLRMAYSNLKEN